MNINPLYLTDFYKTSHHEMYPKGTELIFSNFTPRKSRMPGVDHSVFFGLKYFLKEYLTRQFNQHCFTGLYEGEKVGVIDAKYDYIMKQTLGSNKRYEHITDLLRLNYLPISIYALPEGSVVPNGVPALVMFNTDKRLAWLTNYLETLLSCTLWSACTSATIARQYRLLLDKFAAETSDIPHFVDYQAHDFSMRGMSSVESACISSMAHLQYFGGTDTIPALLYNYEYYGHDLHVASVPATEHSVMSAGTKDGEFDTFKRLINEVYPTGIISIVSDTWDLWRVVDEFLPRLKSDIMARNGRVVIRPDSGDPVEILCGNDYAYVDGKPFAAVKGLIECLWDIFGGTVNSKGYKQLDPHIGAIYGDSITLDRAKSICERLRTKGFASTNIVFGIGSYTYQHVTRDTLGWAMKATYCQINGQGRAITKDPITDDGTKKSASGLLKVVKDGDSYKLLQNQTWEQFYHDDNELKCVFYNGKIL